MKKVKLLIILVLVAFDAQPQQPLRLGLNFPFRNPELTSIENFMEHIGQSGAQLYRQLTYADLIWSTVEPQNNQWNFGFSDSVFKGYPQFEYAANLYSFTVEDIGYQVPWKACETPGCGWNARNDSADTKDYLKTCIDRYSSTVKYWDLGNEAEEGRYPAGLPMLEFARFFAHNYRWIKSINPDVKVILPATVGTYGVPLQNKYNWFRTMFGLGAGKSCDIIGYHDYNSWWTMPVHIDSIMKIKASFGLQEKPLWLSESSSSSVHTSISPAYSSVDEQAADVWRRSCLAWGKGVEMFIWHGCWSSDVPSVWAEFGLLDHHGQKKKSYHSYRLLADKIIEFEEVEIVSQGTISDNNDDPNGGNGIWVVKFVVKGENKYVMWSRNNLSYSVRPVQAMKYKITQVVPVTISPNGETVAFRTDSAVVPANDAYRFTLSNLPILVEESRDLSSVTTLKSEDRLFEVFPNPAVETLGIRSFADKTERFRITDISGKHMVELEIPKNGCSRIDISKWGNGVYLVISQDHLKSQRIVISR
jgi:hypothetical protein